MGLGPKKVGYLLVLSNCTMGPFQITIDNPKIIIKCLSLAMSGVPGLHTRYQKFEDVSRREELRTIPHGLGRTR
jgi:hypothetical protein